MPSSLTPAESTQARPVPLRLFHDGFRYVNSVAFRMFTRLTGLNRLGERGLPYGLPGSLSTLRQARRRAVTQDSLLVERLPSSRKGLAPYQNRQASLGALTSAHFRRCRILVATRT